MEEILDPLQHGMIQYLSVPEFIKLCQTSKTFIQFCDNPETWTYFIRRDFDKTYHGENPKEDYFYKTMIRDMENTEGEEKIWKIMDLVGYGLSDPIPNVKYLNSLATRRFIRLIAREKLDRKYFQSLFNQLGRMQSANTLRLRTRKTKQQYPLLSGGEMTKLSGNIILKGRNEYNEVKNLFETDIDQFINYFRHHRDDPDLGLDEMIYEIVERRDPIIYKILITHIDDPIIRNL